MKNLFLISFLLMLFSCKEKSTQQEIPATPAKQEGWTKPMIVAIDAPTTYYDDIDDEDFRSIQN